MSKNADKKAAKKAARDAAKAARPVVVAEMVPVVTEEVLPSVSEAAPIADVMPPVASVETPFSLGQDVPPSLEDFVAPAVFGDENDAKPGYDDEAERAKFLLSHAPLVAEEEPAIEPIKVAPAVISRPYNGDVVMTMGGAVIRRG